MAFYTFILFLCYWQIYESDTIIILAASCQQGNIIEFDARTKRETVLKPYSLSFQTDFMTL